MKIKTRFAGLAAGAFVAAVAALASPAAAQEYKFSRGFTDRVNASVNGIFSASLGTFSTSQRAFQEFTTKSTKNELQIPRDGSGRRQTPDSKKARKTGLFETSADYAG